MNEASATIVSKPARHDEFRAWVARLRGKAILEDAAKQLTGNESG